MSTISARMPAVMTAPKPLTVMSGLGTGVDVAGDVLVEPLHQALEVADVLPAWRKRQP